jgi:hypothetical protein
VLLAACKRAATGCAAGRLQALDVSECERITHEATCAVAVENAGALVELRLGDSALRFETMRRSPELEQLLRAAPQLRVLDAAAGCDGVEAARRLLRNEAPFRPLRVRMLRVSGILDAGEVRSFADDAAAHEWLTGVKLADAPLNVPAVLDAAVDAALQLRLTYLEFYECRLTPASAPSLARVLGGSALRTLVVEGSVHGTTLLDEPAALLLGNALRANTTLTSATFDFINLFHEPASAAALLGALTAHPSLQKLDLSFNPSVPGSAPAALASAGAAVGALVAANAPALRELRLQLCGLTDVGLGALVDALPANTHLRVLNCRDNRLSDAFTHERLLPAVRANPWLEAEM